MDRFIEVAVPVSQFLVLAVMVVTVLVLKRAMFLGPCRLRQGPERAGTGRSAEPRTGRRNHRSAPFAH
jgi:hypothetical protein